MNPYQRKGYWIIWISFLIGCLLQAIPWPIQFYIFRPSWIALLLIYWVMALPHRVSVGTGLIVGILLDLILGSVLGIRGLAFAILCYSVAFKYQLLRNMALWQQAVVVMLLTLATNIVIFWIEYIVSTTSFHPELFWSCIVNGLLWPWLYLLMRKIRHTFSIQ